MEKKYTGLVVCNTVLILIVLGLAGFIVYDKVINNRPNDNVVQPDNNDEQNKEPKELYSIKKLGDKVSYTGKNNFQVKEGEFSFEYPVININSEEIRRVNSEILKVYQDVYSFINSNYTKEVSETPICQFTIKKNGKLYSGEYSMTALKYNISENDKYLSVVIEEMHITMCGGSTSYLGYTINKETKKVMSNSEILELFNASNDENVFVDAYNENAQSIGLGNAKSIDDLRLYVYDGELVLCLTTNGDYLLKYSNGKLGAV
jgi:hypothetical protein